MQVPNLDPTTQVPDLTSAQQMLHQAPQDEVICSGCDLKVAGESLAQGHNAHCPRCGTELYRGCELSLNTNLILSITCLLLFIPTLYFPFIEVRLLNVNFSASLLSGSMMLFDDGFAWLATLILFCSVFTPLLVFGGVIGAHWGLHTRHFRTFHLSMGVVSLFKSWLMIDVFLISIAVSYIKLRDYADISFEVGLIFLVIYQVFAVTTILKIRVRRYWELWQPARSFAFAYQIQNKTGKQQPLIERHCSHCHLSQPHGHHCVRCLGRIYPSKPRSLQKTWAFLISAAIFLPAANLLNITQVFSNGVIYEDTIMSGVIAFVESHAPMIAFIIFTASIAIPFFKVVSLVYILICIRFQVKTKHAFRMKLFGLVHWIGKWSVLDLFVITIMVNLLNRDQLLDFGPGPAAFAFGLVVIFTMLAAECFDTKLIWKDVTRRHKHIDTDTHENNEHMDVEN